tara:strand:- start:28 stop:2187 length:2160 start_codon:yes stop_codon:yes gene_type:complete
MYANQGTPEQEEIDDTQQEEDPELGMQPEMEMGEELLTYKKLTEKAAPIKKSVDPNLIDPKIAAQAKERDADVARRRAMSTDRAAGNVRDDFQDRTAPVTPRTTPRQPVDTAPKPVVQQTKKSGEIASDTPAVSSDTFKQDVQKIKEDSNATMGEKIESLHDLFRNYGDGLSKSISRYKTEEQDIIKEKARLMKPIQQIFDDGNIDENQKRILLRHGAKFLGDFKGIRKDEAYNDLSDSMINGILERSDMLNEAYALDDSTGLPNPDKIRKFKQDHRVNQFDEDLLKRFWKGLPASVKKNFGGQEINDFEGFSDWIAMDGLDILSGQYLDPESINIDHSVASNFASGPDTPQELIDFINSKDNMISMSKQVNQTLLGKTKPQFLQDMQKMYGNKESRIEGLQDFIYGLNEPKMQLPGNFPRIIKDMLLDDTEDGTSVFKQGLGDDSIDSTLEMANQTNNELLDLLEGKLKEFDTEGFLDQKSVRGLDDSGKSRLSQLRRGRDIISKLRGNAGIHDIYGLLGQKKLPRSFYPTSIRGADFASKEGSDLFKHVKTDLLKQMAEGMSPEDQVGMQQNWANSLSGANGINRNRWNEQHGGRANGRLIDSDGMNKEQIKGREREITDESERNMMQTLMNSGLIRRDMIPENLSSKFEEILGRKRLFEGIQEIESEKDINYQDDDGGDTFHDLLSILSHLMSMGPMKKNKPGNLKFDSFRAKMKE